MNNYTDIINSISVGTSDVLPARPDEQQVKILLQKVLERTGAKYTKNDYYESSKYFIYIGGFPSLHVAVDNKAGTSRLYTIYREEDIKKIAK